MFRSEIIYIKDVEMETETEACDGWRAGDKYLLEIFTEPICSGSFIRIEKSQEQSADPIRGQSANYLMCDDTGSVPIVQYPCTTGTYGDYQEMFRQYYAPYKRDDSNNLFSKEDLDKATLKFVTFDKELPPGHYHVEELPPDSGGSFQTFRLTRNCLVGRERQPWVFKSNDIDTNVDIDINKSYKGLQRDQSYVDKGSPYTDGSEYSYGVHNSQR